MFTPETFTLVCIVLVLFKGTSTIGFYAGSKHLIEVIQNESLIKEIKKMNL